MINGEPEQPVIVPGRPTAHLESARIEVIGPTRSDRSLLGPISALQELAHNSCRINTLVSPSFWHQRRVKDAVRALLQRGLD
jgi:hypothetical protein